MTLSHSGSLIIQVGEKCLDEVQTGSSFQLYPIFDLYGKCEKITILNTDQRNVSPINEEANLRGFDRSIPQREKADLEVHEKETDNSLPSVAQASNAM